MDLFGCTRVVLGLYWDYMGVLIDVFFFRMVFGWCFLDEFGELYPINITQKIKKIIELDLIFVFQPSIQHWKPTKLHIWNPYSSNFILIKINASEQTLKKKHNTWSFFFLLIKFLSEVIRMHPWKGFGGLFDPTGEISQQVFGRYFFPRQVRLFSHFLIPLYIISWRKNNWVQFN
jgi:hypothetical protein